MKKIETKYVVAIIISLIIGASILGYGFLDYKYKSDALEQKINSEKKAQDEARQSVQLKEDAKIQAKKDLQECLDTADENYDEFWYRECKSQGLLTSRCISLHETTFEEYAKKNNIPSSSEDIEKRLAAINTFYKELGDCSCRLPLSNADRIEETKQNERNDCYKKYPQI